MKIKKMLVVGASFAVLATGVASAAQPDSSTTTLPEGKAVIQVPEGRTTVEVEPGSTVEVEAPARIEVEPDASATTTIITDDPAGASASAYSSTSWNPMERFDYDSDAGDELYPDQEFSIDLFGAFADEKRKFNDTFDTTMRDGEWGAGAGVNFFFTRYLGIGGDVFGLDNDGDLVDAASASIIFRLPIDIAHLAPYAFGGAGRQFEGKDEWNAHVGAGLELRFNQHTGIFIDGRHVFGDERSDYALLRSGIRLAF